MVGLKPIELFVELPPTNKFTFHYGRIKTTRLSAKQSRAIAIYIPLWSD